MRCEGVVTEKSEKSVKVKIERNSACGENCASCGMCPGTEQIVEVENCTNADVGDMVLVEMKSKNVLKAAFLVYILPLILLVFGYFVAGIFTESDVICAVTGFIFMIIGFFALHFYDGKNGGKYSSKAVLKVEKTKENI